MPLLPDLYTAAIDSWLMRDQHCSQIDPGTFFERLESVAESLFTGIMIDDKNDKLLVNAGILRDSQMEHYGFFHYSVFEYFLARVLARQMREYSANILARLNLVYMYNVNRFLIPLLQREVELNQARQVTSVAKSLMESCPTINLENGISILQNGITAEQFSVFLRCSHWREGRGFGIWTVKSGPDGTQPFFGNDETLQESLKLTSISSPAPSFEAPQQPITCISWYDALQFCRWTGGRLPSSEELNLIRAKGRRCADHEWTSTWFKESQSLMSVLEMPPISKESEREHGVNPDMRSRMVGFRVAWSP